MYLLHEKQQRLGSLSYHLAHWSQSPAKSLVLLSGVNQNQILVSTCLIFFKCFKLTVFVQQNHGHGDDGDESSSPQQSQENLPLCLQAGQIMSS